MIATVQSTTRFPAATGHVLRRAWREDSDGRGHLSAFVPGGRLNLRQTQAHGSCSHRSPRVRFTGSTSTFNGTSWGAYCAKVNTKQVKPVRLAKLRGNEQPRQQDSERKRHVITSQVSIAPSEPELQGPAFKRCAECQQLKLSVDFKETRRTTDGRLELCRACLSRLHLIRANKDLHHMAMSVEEAWAKSKACSCCRVVKELRDFSRHGSSIDGVQRFCRACHSSLAAKQPSKARSDTPQRCTQCGELKAASAFPVARRKTGGLESACKTCKNIRNKEAYERRKEAAQVPGATKHCSTCGTIRQAADFHKNGNTLDGLKHNCKSCVSAARKVRRQQQRIEREEGDYS